MFIPRLDVSRGWVPDDDATHAAAGGFLRADNLTLNERGVLALRQGSQQLYSLGGPVHSLWTEVLAGVRYRLAGVGSSVYANGAFLVGSINGSGDIPFGAHLSQILFARGTTRLKWDGTTLNNWGIPMTGAAPTVAGAAPDTKTFATGALAEAPAFVVQEDNGSGATHVNDHAGNANGAIQVIASPTSGRATFTKTFAGPTDFTVYDGGTVGQGVDPISVYVHVDDPGNFIGVDLMFDVSDGSFQSDFYLATFNADRGSGGSTGAGGGAPGAPNSGGGVPPPDQQSPADGNYDTQGAKRAKVVAAAGRTPRHGGPRSIGGVPLGFVKLQVARVDCVRIGATAGKDWTTVKAVRFVFRMATSQKVQVDTLIIQGGRLLGQYKWAYVLAHNTGKYEALSAPSVFSAEYTITSQTADITIPSDSSRDPQANEVWLFRMGGVLDTFMRVATKTFSGTGAITIHDTISDIDALVIDIPMETDNDRPPVNIIDIEGPYFDRTFALTSDGFLAPSRQLNPDSFAAGQQIQICGQDDVPLWIHKAIGGLYIGTTKDIYRLEGTGAELPDGSIDFTKRPLNVDHPPINDALAHEGTLTLYLANDGWRAFTGEGTTSIVGDTSLLYRGLTRHGVGPVNLTGGRFRAAIAKGELVTITPEGSDTVESATIYRHAPRTGNTWYRHTYPHAMKTLYREPDGTLLVGESSGLVRILDVATGQDDGVDIPVTLWTKQDAYDSPFVRKELTDLRVTVDTGGALLTVTVYADDSPNPAPTPSDFHLASSGLDLNVIDAHRVGRFRKAQLRMTGSFHAFRYGGHGVTTITRPGAIRNWDSGPLLLGQNELAWIRKLFVQVNATRDLVVTVAFDGAPRQVQTVLLTEAQVGADVVLPIDYGRGLQGRAPRITITSAAEFLLGFVDVVFRSTGQVSNKSRVRAGSAAA